MKSDRRPDRRALLALPMQLWTIAFIGLALLYIVGLSLLGSAAGTLLAFYMAFLGKYSLMTPLALLAFLLLWVLPVLLMSDWAGRY